MITSARPMAISKSRVQTRISWRKESRGASSEGALDDAGAGFGVTFVPEGFSSECSILLPRIYNTSIAERARFRFGLTACQAPISSSWPVLNRIPRRCSPLPSRVPKLPEMCAGVLTGVVPTTLVGEPLTSQGIRQRRQGGNHRGFRSQNQAAQRSFPEAVLLRECHLIIGPATFGSNSQHRFGRRNVFQDPPQRCCIRSFRQKDA